MNSFIYRPPIPYTPIPLEYEDKVETLYQDGHKVKLLHIQNGESLIIFSHGTASDLGKICNRMKHLSEEMKMSVCSYDYIGYGEYNDSYPTEELCKKSIEMVYNRFKSQYKTIVLFGVSLGTGPSLYLAAKEKIYKLILVSPYKSILKVAVDNWIANPILYYIDQFDNEEKIKQIAFPIMIIHGTKDEVIGIEHSYHLASLNKNVEMVVVKDGMHKNMFSFKETIKNIKEFLYK